MRILHLAHFFPPESRGGTQGYLESLAKYQRALGHEIAVVCGSWDLSRGPQVEKSTFDELPVTRIYRQVVAETYAGDLSSERILTLIRDAAREFRPDWIHIHHWHALSHGLVESLKADGHRVAVTLHDLFTTCMRFFRMPTRYAMCAIDQTFADCAACIEKDIPGRDLAELEQIAANRFMGFQRELKRADLVFAVSEAQKKLLMSVPGFDYRKLIVSAIGIDMPDIPAADRVARRAQSAERRQADNRLKIVNWGGLDPRKGVHLIAEAIAKSKEPQQFELHLHGRLAPEDESFGEVIRETMAASQVFFHGPFEASELPSFAARYDIAVFPYLAFETYSLTVDEALMIGIPLVVSDHGAPPERVGQRGVLVPVDDVESLSQILDELRLGPKTLAALEEGSHSARPLAVHGEEITDLLQSRL